MLFLETSPAVVLLLALNIILTLLCFASKTTLSRLLFIPFDVYHNRKWYRLLSSCFIHNDVGHLLFNMLALFSFGVMLEPLLGTFFFVLLYLFCMLLSHLPALLKHKNNPYYRSLGASGAVSGVLYSYICLNPFETIYMQFLIPLPALLFGVLYLFYCWYASRNIKDGIAHDAHFAGAIAGIAFTLAFINVF